MTCLPDLFEHKSYLPTFPIHLQLLDYLLQIWEDDLKNGRPLSVIIPIVVYHGEKGWEQKPFSDFFLDLPEDWRVFVPNFHYLLTDLSRMSEELIEEKQESEYLRNLFMALKFARNKEWIKQNKEKIITFGESFFEQEREGILLQTLVYYIIKVADMTQNEVAELRRKIPETPSSKIVEIAREIFGDEIPRFLKEELRKRMDLQNHAITLKTLQKFPEWSDAEVAEFVGVTVEYVQQMRRELAKGK